MEIRKICQWCGKPFIAQKTTTCYCSHQCSNLGYKERIRERKRQLKRSQELLQPRQAAEGQDFFSFAQAAKLMGVTRQYIYKLVKESKLRASRISGKKSLIRLADIELMMKTKPYERIMPKDDFDISEYYTAGSTASFQFKYRHGFGEGTFTVNICTLTTNNISTMNSRFQTICIKLSNIHILLFENVWKQQLQIG